MHTHLQDDESGIYAQPEVTGGDIPATAQQYMPVEWRVEFLGDVVFDKPPQLLVSLIVGPCCRLHAHRSYTSLCTKSVHANLVSSATADPQPASCSALCTGLPNLAVQLFCCLMCFCSAFGLMHLLLSSGSKRGVCVCP